VGETFCESHGFDGLLNQDILDDDDDFLAVRRFVRKRCSWIADKFQTFSLTDDVNLNVGVKGTKSLLRPNK